MQTTLCIFLVDDQISACCFQEGDVNAGLSVSSVHSQPLKAVFVMEESQEKLIPGFEEQDVAGLLDRYCILSEASDYLRPPVLMNVAETSASICKSLACSLLVASHIPLFYLISDIRKHFASSLGGMIANLLLCCPMHIYAAYTYAIEEAMEKSGFENTLLVNDGCVYAYSFLPTSEAHSKKDYVLSVHLGKDSSYVSCNVLNHHSKPMSIWEETSAIAERSIYTQIVNQFGISSENVSSLLYALKSVEIASCSSSFSIGEKDQVEEKTVELSQSDLTNVFLPSLPSLQSTISACLTHVHTVTSRSSATSLVNDLLHENECGCEHGCEHGNDNDNDNDYLNSTCLPSHPIRSIIVDGLFALPALVTLIRKAYPSIPVYAVEDMLSSKIRGCMQLLTICSIFNSNHSDHSDIHSHQSHQSHQSHRQGYGELYAYGERVYRGLFTDGQLDGFGEQWENGLLVYRGQFRAGQRWGRGELHLHADEVVRGEFQHGQLVEGIYTTRWTNGQPCYEGLLREERRQGVGKVYDQTGELVYEGCFVGDHRHGQGRLRQQGWWYEGMFVEDELDGEVSCYDEQRMLRQICHYDHGVRTGMGKVFSEQGFLLYEGGMDAKGYYGHGIQYYPGKGTQYEGEFLHGQFHGYGQLYSEEGDLLYIGSFRHGLRDGEGKEYTTNTRLLFTGTFREGQREGKGKLFYSLGHFYEGLFHQGQLHGEGQLIWSDGRSYHGEFAKGVKHGKGTFTWTDGSRYEGEWREDKRWGEGKQFDPTGQLVYEGVWERDVARGEGILYLENGMRYEGRVDNLRRVGKGRLFNRENELEYDGEWKDDKPHGYGKYFYGDGLSYEGSWVNGEKDGMGRLNYKDGRHFIGMFKDGMKHGKGCILSRQGKILSEGEYVMNEKVE